MRKKGYFGSFGGQYVPELLMPALIELEKTYRQFKSDPAFQRELEDLLIHYAGRPTPLYFARNLTRKGGGAQILLKREDLNHTGSHKLNNCLGQVLMAKKSGKTRVIAETGAGQHGVATATACALMGIDCQIYMGAEDVKRQKLNVLRMEILGAEVVPVYSGTQTLKDAINEALRNWITHVQSTQYVMGSVVGPHPFPTIVREFQSVIGKEAKAQLKAFDVDFPHYIVACVGGGSNAMGIFSAFENTPARFVGVEAGGFGSQLGQHAASITRGEVGVFHGEKSYFLQDADGQIAPAHSIAAGLDYPGVGPEHAYFSETGRARYVTIRDDEAVEAFRTLSETEGIIPALESAHAVAYGLKLAKTLPPEQIVLINLSGRGDKDIQNLTFEKTEGHHESIG